MLRKMHHYVKIDDVGVDLGGVARRKPHSGGGCKNTDSGLDLSG